MATKVKPCRIQATGTPQVGYVPKYVDEDTFQWGTGGGGSDIVYATQAEYNALLPGAASDGKHYFIYSTSGGLPSAYQEVEYIESSGTQYINPGLSIHNGEKFKIDIDFYRFNQSDGIMFGQYKNSSQGNVMQFGIINSDFWSRFFADSQTPGTWTPNSYTENTRYEFVFEGTAPTNQTYDPYLFAQHQESITGISTARLYSCKLWIDDVLERDFVPCYRIADSVIGLYDLVNDQFYTNSGTGTFTKGQNV